MNLLISILSLSHCEGNRKCHFLSFSISYIIFNHSSSFRKIVLLSRLQKNPSLPVSSAPISVLVPRRIISLCLRSDYYAPRIDPNDFADLLSRPGWLRLRGQESLSSTNRVSLLARKLTTLQTQITTKMTFEPELYQHSAGLVLYYDNMNYVWIRKTWSEERGCPVMNVQEVDRDHVRSGLCGRHVPEKDGGF